MKTVNFLAAAAALALAACSGLKGLDVVGRQSVAAFETVLKVVGDRVTVDEENAGFSLAAPDGSARFIWSGDCGRSPLYDVMLETDAEPFIKAGLKPEGLPDNYALRGGRLLVGKQLGGGRPDYDGGPTPLAAYEHIVRKHRDSLNYHTALDHFGVMLGDGNMFEWAKDLAENGTTGENQDKDIVFVLNPEPLIAAGVAPGSLAGWVYDQVEVDVDGKPEKVWKFLKPFDLQ
jgi:hypothetical protein